ncbi:GH24771 [Drosophila grimshawi]|uniref:GH24771 n=1 Tax=Drosophila grimshawi TaxID=7222 RepID=B4JN89_DROGR|nr:GH24771 [Drosophila grimshawi]
MGVVVVVLHARVFSSVVQSFSRRDLGQTEVRLTTLKRRHQQQQQQHQHQQQQHPQQQQQRQQQQQPIE